MKSWKLIVISLFIINSSSAATHHPEEFLAKIQGAKDEGKQIVLHFCSTCHAEKPLIELGAPKSEKLTDWKPRIKQGLAKLLEHTAEGYNAMPARGGCFECSDQQLQLAILAMMPLSLQEELKNALIENK